MDKIATIKHSNTFQSQKFSIVGNVNSLVSSYNFVNQRTEGDSTAFDIEPVIDFKYNTLPTAGLIKNVPYKCLYDGGDAGYPQILDKQRTFSITTSVNNDKVFHRPGDPLYYSTQASSFTSPYFCVAVDDTFFSSSSELYPILLYAPVGTWANSSGLDVKSFLCLSSAYVTTSNMDYARILSSDSDFSKYAGPYQKKEGVCYTKKGDRDEPHTMFRSGLIDPIWVDNGGISSIWHFNPKKIDANIDDGYSAYYTYSKYLDDGVPRVLSGLDVEVLILTYHILDFVFEGEPSPTYDLGGDSTDFSSVDKTYTITLDDYTWNMSRSSRNKFYVRYIQYKV